MANPLITQGTLNRLKMSVIIPAFPELNITPPFLLPAMLTLRLDGPVVTRIPTSTGSITSLEPVQHATVVAALMRTQSLADLYKRQMESNALIGDITVRGDSALLSPYQFINCSILGVPEQIFNGTDPGYAVTLEGYYPVNNQAWS